IVRSTSFWRPDPRMSAATYNQPLSLPAYRGAPIATAVDDTSQFQRLGFNVLLVFIFMVFSRIFDVKFGGLHITGIAYRIVFAMVLLSRAFVPAIETKIGKSLVWFTVF